METWKLGLDHWKEIFERVLHELEQDIDWVKEIRVAYEEYLKLMTYFDMSAIELDLEKIKPYFHKKMENGTKDALTLEFMGFAAWAFTRSD